MLAFFLRRLLWGALTLWAVVTLSFFLMRNVPGGPFDGEREIDPVIKANIERQYHLDWPQWKQYVQYIGPFNLDETSGVFSTKTIEEPLAADELAAGDTSGTGTRTVPNPRYRSDLFGGVLAFDFGPSFKLKDFSVNDIIGQSLPISVALGSIGLLWALLLGLTAGIASALERGTGWDLSLRLVATMGIALPNFVIAGFLIMWIAFNVDALPVAGWGAPRHILLPSLALGAPFAAYIARLTRTGMLEVFSQDHIRTARAKGLPDHLVLFRHALKGGLLPVVSYLGPAVAGILTGSLVIERLFGIPGTGSHFINSALNRDYTLAMGVTILYTVLVYSLNTLVDLAYTLLDPRIKLEES
jgi:oligopeptide transport system permease protein